MSHFPLTSVEVIICLVGVYTVQHLLDQLLAAVEILMRRLCLLHELG